MKLHVMCVSITPTSANTVIDTVLALDGLGVYRSRQQVPTQ